MVIIEYASIFIFKYVAETIEYNPRDSHASSHDLGSHSKKQHKEYKPESDEKVYRFYNFTVTPPDHPTQPIHLYGYFGVSPKDNFTTTPLFDFLVGESPLVKFIPFNYQIQMITIEGSEDPFTLITGRRCKWVCDRRSRKCGEGLCWEEPSFCRGSHEDCLKLDGNGTCFDITEKGFPSEYYNGLSKSNKTHKVFTTIDVGKFAQFHGEDFLFISDDGQAQDLLKLGFHWVCKEETPGSEYILCDTDWMHVGVTTRVLKTIAG